jgi:hypothetical protein
MACSISLIIVGEDLDPAEVSNQLGLIASQMWRKGEQKQFTRPDGTILLFESIHERGGWKLWQSESERKLPIEVQLSNWLARLRSKTEAFHYFHNKCWAVELNFFISESDSFELDQVTMNELIQLRINVSMTVVA